MGKRRSRVTVGWSGRPFNQTRDRACRHVDNQLASYISGKYIKKTLLTAFMAGWTKPGRRRAATSGDGGSHHRRADKSTAAAAAAASGLCRPVEEAKRQQEAQLVSCKPARLYSIYSGGEKNCTCHANGVEKHSHFTTGAFHDRSNQDPGLQPHIFNFYETCSLWLSYALNIVVTIPGRSGQ